MRHDAAQTLDFMESLRVAGDDDVKDMFQANLTQGNVAAASAFSCQQIQRELFFQPGNQFAHAIKHGRAEDRVQLLVHLVQVVQCPIPWRRHQLADHALLRQTVGGEDLLIGHFVSHMRLPRIVEAAQAQLGCIGNGAVKVKNDSFDHTNPSL